MKITSGMLVSSMISGAFLLSGPIAGAASKEARVTQIIREVTLLPSEEAERPAAVDDKVSEDTGIKTGEDSRSELTFPDLTITRLGANTIFSFSKAGRTAKVDSGSILLRVPKDSGGATIKNNAVTVAITGTTVIFEGSRGTESKLTTLEGSARFSLTVKPREFRTVRAGQMLDVPAGATTLPMPVNIDLDDLMRNHPLITDFKPLPSQPRIVAATKQKQPSPPPRRPIRPPPPPPPPTPTPPPPRTSGPKISIDIFGGGYNRGPRRTPPRRPPPDRPPADDSTTQPPTTNRSPGSTKPPTTQTPRYQKPPKPKSTPSPSGPR